MELAKLEQDIVEVDGTCRDITFADLSRTNAIALLSQFAHSFKLESANDIAGADLRIEEAERCLMEKSSGSLQTAWSCNGLISQLQLYLAWTTPDCVFAEITFFPQDVRKKDFGFEAFAEFLQPLILAANAERFFVRFENASWQFGDTSRHSGVIFSDREFAHLASKTMESTR